MINYKLRTIDTYSVFGGKKDFTDEQKESLKTLGFRLTFMDLIWEKLISGGLKIEIVLSKKHLYFYDSYYFLPCELNERIKNKDTLKEVHKVIKELKRINVI